MAKILSDRNSLKCRGCDIVFRHEESEHIQTNMFDSPCCHRRYSLHTLRDRDGTRITEDGRYIMSHGWASKENRDKHDRKDPNGITWANNG